MRYFAIVTFIAFCFYCKAFASNFFIGFSAVNLNNQYDYDKLKVRQYVGEAGGVQVNQYVELEFPKSSSFGASSTIGRLAPSISLGYKFYFGDFHFTPEIFGFYDSSVVEDLTVVPAQNFTGLICTLPDCKPPVGAIVQEINIPEQIQSIKYFMPINTGIINRFGIEFDSISINILGGATMTVFKVDDGTNTETIYTGRFIAGIGVEWEPDRRSHVTFFVDYKYLIPVSKDIDAAYSDPRYSNKKIKVAITGFKASTQMFEIGFKYYI